MSLPSLYIGRGRSWIVALFFLLLGGLVVGFLPEAERDASPTDSLAQGYDSTRVVELAERELRSAGELIHAPVGELPVGVRRVLLDLIGQLRGRSS